MDTLNIACSFLYCNHLVHRSFFITLYKFQTKEDGMGSACDMFGQDEKCMQNLLERLKRTGQLQDV